jgi:RHS repeat-associated protein
MTVGDVRKALQEKQRQANITVLYFHCDHIGTPLALLDQHKKIVWAARRDPWGNLQEQYNPSGIIQPIGLPGQHYDMETGLYYNGHRYYDARMGCYINQDPIGLRGGLNLYGYTGNNPLNRIDPSGLTWGDDWSMFWQWVGGTAPANTVYGPGTNQSNDMMQSAGVKKAIDAFKKKYSGQCPEPGQSLKHYDYSFGLSELIDAGTNPTQQFVGSYSVNIFPNNDGSVNVHVYNTTSMTSFLYGLYPNSWNPSNGHPMGNASQEYIGIVPNVMITCGCGK